MPRWLDTAGVDDPRLRACYVACGQYLRRREWAMYCAGILTMPPAKRPYLSALAAFFGYVDDLADTGDPAGRAQRVAEWANATNADLLAGRSDHPVRQAFVHTVRTFDLPTEHLPALFAGNAEDAVVTGFVTYRDLQRHIYDMTTRWMLLFLPVVGIVVPLAEIEPAVRTAGEAMQLTDCLDDLAEDLANGRCYLPAEDLVRFGVTVQELRDGLWSERVAELLAFEVARIRELLAMAERAVPMLHPWLRPLAPAGLALAAAYLDDLLGEGPRLLRGGPRRRLLVRRLRGAALAYLAARRGWRTALPPVPRPAPALP